MPSQMKTTRRARNREAVRKHREKVQRDENEMEILYRSNEEKIARLEKMADRLCAELLKTSIHRWHSYYLTYSEITAIPNETRTLNNYSDLNKLLYSIKTCSTCAFKGGMAELSFHMPSCLPWRTFQMLFLRFNLNLERNRIATNKDRSWTTICLLAPCW